MNMTPRERHYRLLRRRGVPPKHALRLATGYLIGIGLGTNTSFVAGRDDGFGNDNRARKAVYRNARKLGINPNGKIYSPQLARKGMGMGRDPEAWLDAGDAKDQVKRVCQNRGHECDGMVKVKGRPNDQPDPLDKPYEVAQDIVDQEVDTMLARENATVTPKELTEITEKTKKRLSGKK